MYTYYICVYIYMLNYIDYLHSIVLLGFLLNVEKDSSLEKETKRHCLERRGVSSFTFTSIDKNIRYEWSCAASSAVCIIFC